MKRDIRQLTMDSMLKEFEAMGLPRFRARQVFGWLHQKRVKSFGDMRNLPLSLRERLEESYSIGSLRVVRRLSSKIDETEKFLFALPDGNCIEAVWMEYKHGSTVCISTQVGCRMGCKFCASTLGGLVRSLNAGEMIGEIYALEEEKGKKVGGVVLMGIGEPLDNFEAVTDFLEILSCKDGMNLSLRHVSLSTCGLVPEIDRLSQLRLPLTLSISLHAPDDATRSAIMPINNRYGVKELMAACRRYFERTGRRISFEYALIAGENDTPGHAARLIALLRGEEARGMPIHVNLIPVNEVRERACRRGSRQAIQRFEQYLAQGGVNATIRRELGADIAAACGQLRRETTAKEENEGA